MKRLYKQFLHFVKYLDLADDTVDDIVDDPFDENSALANVHFVLIDSPERADENKEN